MDKNEMMNKVFHQLALDYNCLPEDFLKDEIIFTEAKALEGRRPYPFFTPRLELITFGSGVVVNASGDIIDRAKSIFKNKSAFEIFNMPFVCGVNPYFLPNLSDRPILRHTEGFEFKFIEKSEISKLYSQKGFELALQYDVHSLHPEQLAVVVITKDTIVGVASAVSECKTLWQINVDVLPQFRGNNLATTAVSMLTNEVLKRGYVPYYSTSIDNIFSLRVAAKSGYLPSWAHCYRTRMDLLNV